MMFIPDIRAARVNAIDAVVVAGVLITIWAIRSFTKEKELLPPGPKKHNLGERAYRLAAPGDWKTYTDWAQKYGPIISFKSGGKVVIILNKYKDAVALLEKRGENYASRPRMVMAQEVLSNDLRGAGMQFCERWKRWRKIQVNGMSGRQSLTYRDFQMLESTVLLYSIMKDNKEYMKQMDRYAASIVFNIAYGTRIPTLTDGRLVQTSGVARRMVQSDLENHLVERYPALLKLPKPLQWFRWSYAKDIQEDRDLLVGFLEEVRRKVENGSARECTTTRAIPTMNADNYWEIAYALNAPFTAGVGTTTSSIQIGLLAALHFPETVKKVQEEMASVIGQSRMPTFDDEPHMPYTAAWIQESMRWRTVAPTGLPHASIHDDYYEGYFIPAGSTVFANIHAMTMDPEMFPDPESFRPERFLDKDGKVIDFDLIFGFGRRVCPGRHVAWQSIYIALARIFWAFNILPEVDEKGRPILPDTWALDGVPVRRANPFRIRFEPRNEDIVKLLEEEASSAEEALKSWE